MRNEKKGSDPRAERHKMRPHVAFARNGGPMWPIGNWFTHEKPSPNDWIRSTHAAAALNTRALSAAHCSSACAPQAVAIKWSSGLGFQGAGSLAGAQPVRHKSWCHSFARPYSKSQPGLGAFFCSLVWTVSFPASKRSRTERLCIPVYAVHGLLPHQSAVFN